PPGGNTTAAGTSPSVAPPSNGGCCSVSATIRLRGAGIGERHDLCALEHLVVHDVVVVRVPAHQDAGSSQIVERAVGDGDARRRRADEAPCDDPVGVFQLAAQPLCLRLLHARLPSPGRLVLSPPEKRERLPAGVGRRHSNPLAMRSRRYRCAAANSRWPVVLPGSSACHRAISLGRAYQNSFGTLQAGTADRKGLRWKTKAPPTRCGYTRPTAKHHAAQGATKCLPETLVAPSEPVSTLAPTRRRAHATAAPIRSAPAGPS